MTKRHTPFFENKIVGHAIAVFIFAALAVALYYATTVKINYIWQWNSIPNYFVYEEEDGIKAPYSGDVVIKEGILTIMPDNELEGEKPFSLSVKGFERVSENGEYVYEDETIASKTILKRGPIVNGLIVTVQVSMLALLIAFVMGAVTALIRLSKYQFLKDIAIVYITVIRGTPLLVQMSLFYFIIASILKIDGFYAGALSLGIFYGAYIAEVLRGAIQSIDKGQHEAAKSLGMNAFQTISSIIVPQALRRALPTLINEVISLVKDSSLVSVIAITDLTRVGREIASQTFNAFEAWITIAGIYLIITFTLSIIGSRIEARMKERGGF
ncbi:MAG: amino acid ABC transporter permease [Campylobacteraceae bacterium]|jgi:polar amino acid transport system permease protein|nr:amino acid ABC transporter permease [Campylobacteraceae bacterium]